MKSLRDLRQRITARGRGHLTLVPSPDLTPPEADALRQIVDSCLPVRQTGSEWWAACQARAREQARRCPVRCENSYGVHPDNRALAERLDRLRRREK